MTQKGSLLDIRISQFYHILTSIHIKALKYLIGFSQFYVSYVTSQVDTL